MQTREKLVKLQAKANSIFLGKQKVIHLATLSLICQGHLLIEDRPGVGKTTLANMLAKLFGLKESRIQFTNDLLPADLIGSMIFEQKTGDFSFKHGPIFGNLIIADELNRATPKTQSAMLQCMEERSISIDGENYPLPSPFIVMATQNPFQFIGTFELPESQIDRFFMGLIIDYPQREAEKEILLAKQNPREILPQLESMINKEELQLLKQALGNIAVAATLVDYILDIIDASRNRAAGLFPADCLPLSVRAGLDLTMAARAQAYLNDRNYVIPDDIQFVAPAILGHRIAGNKGIAYGVQIVEEALKKIAIKV